MKLNFKLSSTNAVLPSTFFPIRWGTELSISFIGCDYVFSLKDYLTLLGLHLQPHQVTGVNMILSWYCNSHGGIIADEMGLGKTCQVIAALHVLISRNEEARNLIIVPLSVVDHWETELKRLFSATFFFLFFSFVKTAGFFNEPSLGFRFGLGKLRFVRYTGHSEERRKLRKDLEICEWNTLLTTYQVFVQL